MSIDRVIVLESKDQWVKLSPNWNKLLEASTSESVFLTWEWLFAWTHFCLGENRKLYAVLFYKNEQLIGIAPFYIHVLKKGPFTIRELRFLGTPEAGSDYLDVFADKGMEKEVANGLYNFLMGPAAKVWDQMALRDMPANSLFLLHFTRRIEKEGKYFELRQNAYCPIAHLEASVEKHFEQISPKRMQKIRQKSNKLNRHGSVIHDVFIRDIPEHAIADFFKYYEEKAGWSSEYVRPIIEKVVKHQNEVLNIQFDFLRVDGQVVTGLVFLRYKDTLSQYLMFTDKNFLPNASVGIILIVKCLENAVNTGIKAYDFLKGIEEYKFHWSNAGISTMQLNFWQKKPSAIYSAYTNLVRHAGKLILR